MSDDANKAPAPAPQSEAVKDAAHKAAPVVPPEKSADEIFTERLKAERLKWDADQATKAQKAKDAAEQEEARKRGEFEKLAQKAEAERDEWKAKAVTSERAVLVNDAFAEALAANEGLTLDSLNEWVRPKVLSALTAESTPDEVKAQAKQLAEKYAKANPPKAKGSAGAPGNIPGRQPVRGGTAPATPSESRSPRRWSTLNTRV